LSTTKSLKHNVEQNIKMLENYRQQKTVEMLDPTPLKCPKNSSGLDSPNNDRGEIANSPTRYNEPLSFSALSEWTMLGEGFDEDEDDWLEPAPYKTWKPTIESEITSQIPIGPTQNSLVKDKLRDVQMSIDDQMKEELTALMRCEELYLDPSSSDTSESHSSGSEDVDDLAYVSIQDFPEERSEVRELRSAPNFHQMKQAFVDRVIEDFYESEKGDGAQEFSNLLPPDLIHPALKAA